MTLLRLKIGLLILGCVLFFPMVAGATSILKEDFNSCNLGDLGSNAGCSGWATTTTASPQATSTDKIEGTIGGTGVIDTATEIFKAGSSFSAGEIWFYSKSPSAGTFSYNTTLYALNSARTKGCGVMTYEQSGFLVVYMSNYTGGGATYSHSYALGSWRHIGLKWRTDGTLKKCSIQVENDGWEEFTAFLGTDAFNTIDLKTPTPTKLHYFDYIDDLPAVFPASIVIDTPVSGTTASSTFTAGITYNKQAEEWDKIMLIFENWEASSTCPVYGTSAWTDEYALGYFNYGSLPYFSDTLATTTAAASVEVENLDENLYNCVRCYFVNSASSTLSVEKCEDYTLTIAGFIPPSQPLPVKTWAQYYTIHSDPKYATSTEIFNTIASAFNVIVQKVGSFIVDFRTIFDSNEASAKGTELGSKIPLARGYLKPINDFFGGTLPVSEFFIFALLVLIIVGVFRMVKIIVQFIRG